MPEKETKETKPPKATKPAEPEMVSLKEVAKKAGVEPREARSILRKISTRGEDQKRSRWQFAPGEVNAVVSKIKNAKVAAEKAKAEKAAAAEDSEDDE